MKRLISAVLCIFVLFTALFTSSCDGGDVTPEVTISLSRVNVELNVGDVYVLVPTVSPKNYETNITWQSSNSAVATCEDGTVRAHSVGKCNVTATADNGAYFVSYVTVNEKTAENVYMQVGQTVALAPDVLSYLEAGSLKCLDETVASCSVVDGKPFVTAHRGGVSSVVLTDGISSISLCDVFVLTEDRSYNVTVELPDAPVYVPYQKGIYETGVVISDVRLDYELTEELLAEGLVRVKITFIYSKTYDSNGENGRNATGFTFEIYSGEKEDMLRSYDVTERDKTVESAQMLTYEYRFDAVLDDGDGERSFAIVVPNARAVEDTE